MRQHAAYFRPEGLDGIEALHARFVRHAYRPHSHPTWTVAVVKRGAARLSGITARAGVAAIGAPYRDADGREYLPLLVQPVLVFAADRSKLHTVRERAERRDVPLALYTAEMFRTGNDADNRAAVRAVATANLDLVGLALRAPRRDADAVLRGLERHP